MIDEDAFEAVTLGAPLVLLNLPVRDYGHCPARIELEGQRVAQGRRQGDEGLVAGRVCLGVEGPDLDGVEPGVEPHVPPYLPEGVYEASAPEVVHIVGVLRPGAEGLGE